MSALRFRDYLGRYFKMAFWHAPDPIDLWSGLAGAALTAVAHFVPSWSSAVNDVLWQIPLWAAAAIVGARLLLAPFWIAREDRAAFASATSDLAKLNDSLAHTLKATAGVHVGMASDYKDLKWLLVIGNSAAQPIRYENLNFSASLDGGPFSHHNAEGGAATVLASGADSTYELPFAEKYESKNGQLEITATVDYGFANGKPARRLATKLRVHFKPMGAIVDFRCQVVERTEEAIA